MRSGRRRVWAGFVAACVVTAAAGVLVGAQVPSPPPLLGDALKARPEWRLLDPTTDLVGDYTIAQLEALDRWPPWMEMDVDRDGRDDIAAVVVRPAAGKGPEFSVVVVHAATPGQVELVVPFGAQRIFGVSEGIKDDTVMPLRCADCDANIWFRWGGRAYEPLLHAVGEPIRIGGEPGKPSPLFEAPRADAGRTAEVQYCMQGEVREVSGEQGQRWYRLSVVAPGFPRGWVPQQFVMEDGDCKP